MGWPLRDHPLMPLLERVLRAHFEDSVPHVRSGQTEIRIRLSGGTEREFEVVVVVNERQQVVVEEVKRRKSELQGLTFSELEVLHQGQITIPEHRTWQIGHAVFTELARRVRCEAVGVRSEERRVGKECRSRRSP